MTLFYSFLGFFVARKNLFRFLALVFFLGLGVSVVYRGAVEVPRRTDLTVYLAAADAVRDGTSLYTAQNSRGWNYLYLPLLAALLSPFTKLPLAWLVVVWYLLSLAALYGSVRLLARIIGADGSMFLSVAAYVLTLPCLVHTLARGQVGVLVLFLMLAVFYSYTLKKPAWTGLLLSLVIVLKTSPAGFLLIFFLARAEWKTLAWTFAGFLVWLGLVPSLFLGLERNLDLAAEWLRMTQVTLSARPWETAVWHQATTPFAADNQSLPALVARLWWGTEQALFAHSNTFQRHGFRGLMTLALGGLAFVTAQIARGDLKRLFAAYSLFAALMLLFSPVSESHHYTVLFALFGSAFWLREEAGPRMRTWLDAGVWTAFVSYLSGLLFDGAGWWGAPVAGLLFLSAALVRAAAGAESAR